MWSKARRKIRRTIILRILHLDDTPHRIAFGVFLGFVVGWSPTMGAQIILYWIFATLLRANKASGVLPVLLTNPITAAPVYFFNWKVGQWILHGGGAVKEAAAELQRQRIDRFLSEFSIARIFEAEFWRNFGDAFRMIGAELIMGCLVVGLICGIVGYVATYYGVKTYRTRREAAKAAGRTPPGPETA